jgi:hypothetical protein
LPHHHSHDCEGHAHDGPTSTGFLPLSLAVTLFVTGLFALDWVHCAPSDADDVADAATARRQ